MSHGFSRETFFIPYNQTGCGPVRNGETMKKKQVELLAPAGSFESMKAAVAAGADAVYMGGSRFGARAYADNPDEDKMLEAIDYVHLHGCRLYMTVNTLFKEEELKELVDYLMPYYLRGLDGVIVQDTGALKVMREHFPGMELHASTQMTITSVYGAKMLKSMGCCRVVPARELSLEEIRRIHEEADVEIESFVHGALCYCYSGQCLMSSLIGGRSGNRGRCAQPCRLPYSVFQGKTALNRSSEKYVMSLKDLCTLDILPRILKAGVYSLKIEGRMKSPRYTAGVVSIYRKYVDRYLEYGEDGYYVEPEDKKTLLELFDRGGFTTGYYEHHNGCEMVALKEKPEFREGNQALFEYLDKNFVEKDVKENVRGTAFFAEGVPASFLLSCGDVQVNVTGEIPQAAQNQPMSREKVLKQLNKTGNTPFVFEELQAEITGNLFMPVQALNELRRLGLEELEKALLAKWGREVPEADSAVTEPERGVPGGQAQLRSESARPVEDTLLRTDVSQADEPTSLRSNDRQPGTNHLSRPSFTASVETNDQFETVLACPDVTAVYIDAAAFLPESWKREVNRCHENGKQCWLILPHIFRTQAMDYFKAAGARLFEAGFDGLLARNLEEVQWLKEKNIRIPYGLDASVYAWNHESVDVLGQTDAAFLTMPWELNSREMEPVAAACRREQIPASLIVYGHAPMMVSAQCIMRTTKGCTHKPELLSMKDRTGAILPVKNQCAFCYNTIYNPLPLSLLGYERAVEKMGISNVRLAFTVETAKETKDVLNAFSRAFLEGEESEEPVKDFTRGHFKRGVE